MSSRHSCQDAIGSDFLGFMMIQRSDSIDICLFRTKKQPENRIYSTPLIRQKAHTLMSQSSSQPQPHLLTSDKLAHLETPLRVGLVSISDRASSGVYQDQGIPALKDWLSRALTSPTKMVERLVQDERETISTTLIELVDKQRCHLVLTTGGTGPSRRDVTPEATIAVATREMPGFGEQMRQISLQFVPTAILSRQVAVLRETPDHAALIINLPGQPKAIAETLEGLRQPDGSVAVKGIFAAVPYCIDLIGGPYIETNESVVKAFRPKSAIRTKPQTP